MIEDNNTFEFKLQTARAKIEKLKRQKYNVSTLNSGNKIYLRKIF